MAGYVSEAVIRRLPGYYRHLCELEAMGVKQISSQEMGRQMHLIPSQIRQDINCFGGFGRKGYGYNVTSLRQHIGEILGLDHPHSVIIIGAGSIGSALAHYPDFHGETFDTKALFDIDPTRVGTNIGGVPVYSMEELDSYLASHAVDIAVLEGLYLEGVEDGTYTLSAFPLKISGVEAAPCRAILIGETKGI